MRLIYAVPFFISSLGILTAAAFALRRRRARGAGYLILTCLSAAVYAIFEGLRYLMPDLATDMLMTYLQYIGVATMIPLAILFTLDVFNLETWVNRTTIALLSIGGAATLVMVWTDPLHHLVYSDCRLISGGAFPMRVYTPGILWWVIVVYHYLLMIALTLLLIHVLRTSVGIHRTQAGLILAGAATVWAAHAVYISGNSPVANMDISPLAFIVVAASMLICFSRFHLLDVLPFAKEEVFTGLRDPILVLDVNNHLLDLNPAAETLLGIRGTKSLGRDIEHLLAHHPKALDSLRKGTPEAFPLVVKDRRRHFAIRFSALTDRRGKSMGRIILFQDITERKEAEEAVYEAERLRGVLEMAGAVCHDLSQPAMAAGGYAELILAGTSTDEPQHSPLAKLVEQVEKLGDINKKLLKITQYKAKIG